MSRQKILADIKKVCRKLTPPYKHQKYKNKGGLYGKREIKKFVGDWESAVMEALDKSYDEIIIDQLQKPCTVVQLADALELPPKRIHELIDDLLKKGVEIKQQDNTFRIDKKIIVNPQDQEFTHQISGQKQARIALISDTHIGSTCQQLTYLRDFYEKCEAVGVSAIYHAGDILAGNGKVYRGQEYELFVHGLDDTLDYFEEVYPKIDGVNTYFITGNHDLSTGQALHTDS